jgi:subtilisin family serine protease
LGTPPSNFTYPSFEEVCVARSRIRVAAVTGLFAALGLGVAFAPVDAGAPQLGSFIVTLDDAVSAPDVLADHAARFGVRRQGARVFQHALNGYAADLPTALVGALLGDARVKAIELNAPVHIDTTQTTPPWGIDRSDQRSLPLSASYTYTRTGAGVTVYVLDTGIRYSHSDFGGRAIPGFDAVTAGGDAADCNGHGTHTAGTVGGATYGIAKGATLVSVRVLNCSGNGDTAGIIAALDWIVANHGTQPAVANMSLSSSVKQLAMNSAVQRVIADRVQVVMSAGNGNDFGTGKDACKISPASVREGITVAATDRQDTRPGWSNFGPCVDVFAPGVEVLSADGSNDTGARLESGTSMSAPHVTGAVAKYLQTAPGASPSQVHTHIVEQSTKGVVKRPNGGLFNNIKSPNRLLFTNL